MHARATSLAAALLWFGLALDVTAQQAAPSPTPKEEKLEWSRVRGTAVELGISANGIVFAHVAAGLLLDLYLGRENPDAALFRVGR